MRKRAGETMSLVVACGTCRSSYRLGKAFIRGVRRVRIRCRRCGAFIDVLNTEMPPVTFLGKRNPGNPGNPGNPSSNPSGGKSRREEDMTVSVSDVGKPATTEQGRKGWISPDYIVSRAVGLDPDRLARNRCVAFDPGGLEVEFYRVLRAKILHRTEGIGGVTVMVTSALPGEGKTTTAINLAFAFAKSYAQTVLLVDADLRQQKIREFLGFENDKGLADYLLDSCPLSDTIVWPGIEKLTILAGGRTRMESSELLGSPGMKVLVEEMKSRYPERYVIFDVAPVLIGADALAFAQLVDCILFVVQAGRTSLPDVKRAINMLPQEKVLGMVLNRDPHAVMTDYYKYYKNNKYYKNR